MNPVARRLTAGERKGGSAPSGLPSPARALRVAIAIMSVPPHDEEEEELVEWFPGAYLNDDGDVIIDRSGPAVEAGEVIQKSFEVNVSKLFQKATRETSNVEVLVMEAKILAEKGTIDNPATPANEQTEREARRLIDNRGLSPAWEATDAEV